MGNTLLSGQVRMEWGWMLCTYIPYLRYMSRQFKRTIVPIKPEYNYLVSDFAETVAIDHDNYVDRWLNHGKIFSPPKKVWKKFPKAQIVMPGKQTCMCIKREHLSYGQVTSLTPQYDIIIHARASQKYRSAGRNWSPHKYEETLRLLGKLKVASVGTEAYHIPGTDDLRGIKLDKLCGILKASRMVIGPSSGLMHLAHLCKASILVWSSAKKQKCIHATNRQRYEVLWRGFDSPVHVLDSEGWSPKVKTIAHAIEKDLK